MTVVDDAGYDEITAAVTLEREAGIVRIVVRGVFSEATSALARELLLDAYEQGTGGVELAIEAVVEAVDYDELRHLVDVAHRRCWAASCRLEVTVLDPEAGEALAAAGMR